MSYLILKKCYNLDQKKKKKDIIKIDYDKNEFYVLSMFIGKLNKKGKKSLSYYIFTNILFFLKKESAKKPLAELSLLLNNVKPSIVLFKSKKGASVYELPQLLTVEQSTKKAIEWLIQIALNNKKDLIKSVILELKNIFLEKGEVLKKKEQIRIIAEKNRPFFYLLKKKKKK